MPMKVEQQDRTVDVTRYYCDWCDAIIEFAYFQPRPCCLCGRYACKTHSAGWKTADGGGDYPDEYCPECWAIGEMFRQAIQASEAQIEVLQQDWAKIAKAAAEEKKR